MPHDVQHDSDDPIHHLIARAQYSPSAWQDLHDEIIGRAGAGGCLAAVKVVSGNDTLVRSQIATRALPGPHSTGPVEQFLHHLDATIGDRTARLTNKTRTNALLKLLAAQRNGWANETAWAKQIREHILARRGRALSSANVRNRMVATVRALGERDMIGIPTDRDSRSSKPTPERRTNVTRGEVTHIK